MAPARLDSLGMIVLLAAALAAPIPRMSDAAEACAPALARIVSLQGLVEFRSSETEPWTGAALNDLLCVDSWIRVGPSSRAALALPNDSVLRLDQQTTVRLRARAEETRSLLDLFLGTLYLFSHRPRALEVDTPFVNAATEGTEFLVSVGADQTRIIVFEGRILAQNPDGELLLASGDAAVAAAGEAPRAQVVAQPRDAVAWTLYYPPILAALAEREPAPRGLPPGLQTAVDRVAGNDYPGALRALDTVPDGARDARYWAYRAGVLLNVGRVEEARDAIDQALALDPQAGEALAQRAIIALVQDRRDEALADARRAIELSPDSAAARIALSYAQQAAFQLEAARATLREAVEIAPEDALAWARLSEIELSFGELRAALEAADRAVALAPQLSRTQTVLGFADLARFDVGEARMAFERAIALDSADPLPRLGLGLAMIRQSDLEQGRNEIEIAAALDPDNSLLRSYLGKAFFEEKRDQLAGEQYAIAKRLDPLDPTPWLYDAIRLQTENRPVEALRDLNRSIALNDNRAVFRSSLLLDEDLATRQVSLARIYDDLGFEQVGVLEATRSLSLDPANSSAHRFLSDVYAGLPRHEIARASELLQAQLLQPININPVQPSLPITDLNIVAGAGPGEPSFNELTPMFQRNGVQLTASGLADSNNTLGEEVIVSGLHNRVSASIGQLYSDSDGFRSNNDLKNELYNVFGQVAVSPELSLQAEYRYRHARNGDIDFNFDPDDFSENDKLKFDQNVGRVGLRYSPATHSDFLLSVFYADRDEKQTVVDDTFNISAEAEAQDHGYQTEGQYLFHSQRVNLTTGVGVYNVDVDQRLEVDFGAGDPLIDEMKFNRSQENGYLYANVQFPDDLTWTLGASLDKYKEEDFDRSKINPKIGLQWDIVEQLRLRLGFFETIKPALAVQQTLEPTQVAGFNQFFDDPNFSETKTYAVAMDAMLFKNVYGGVEYRRRDLNVPGAEVTIDGTTTVVSDRQEDFYGAYVYWTPHDQWSVTGGIYVERFDQSGATQTEFPSRVTTISFPLAVNYFNPNGVFAGLGVDALSQDVKRPSDSQFKDGDEQKILLNTSVGYRFPRRLGLVSVEARNLLDEKFNYQDLNFLTPNNRVSPLIPERTVLVRATLTF